MSKALFDLLAMLGTFLVVGLAVAVLSWRQDDSTPDPEDRP